MDQSQTPISFIFQFLSKRLSNGSNEKKTDATAAICEDAAVSGKQFSMREGNEVELAERVLANCKCEQCLLNRLLAELCASLLYCT
jgi:hypothetical protein